MAYVLSATPNVTSSAFDKIRYLILRVYNKIFLSIYENVMVSQILNSNISKLQKVQTKPFNDVTDFNQETDCRLWVLNSMYIFVFTYFYRHIEHFEP